MPLNFKCWIMLYFSSLPLVVGLIILEKNQLIHKHVNFKIVSNERCWH